MNKNGIIKDIWTLHETKEEKKERKNWKELIKDGMIKSVSTRHFLNEKNKKLIINQKE